MYKFSWCVCVCVCAVDKHVISWNRAKFSWSIFHFSIVYIKSKEIIIHCRKGEAKRMDTGQLGQNIYCQITQHTGIIKCHIDHFCTMILTKPGRANLLTFTILSDLCLLPLNGLAEATESIVKMTTAICSILPKTVPSNAIVKLSLVSSQIWKYSVNIWLIFHVLKVFMVLNKYCIMGIAYIHISIQNGII